MPERLKLLRKALKPGEISYVLVVEDDIDLRASAVMLLQHEGIKAVGASNGVEALKVIIDTHHPYPLAIFLDIQMPMMTGWDVLACMNCMIDEIKHIPVIITSGESIPHNERYVVLKKPYTLEQMLNIIEEVKKQAGLMPRGPDSQ